LTNSFLNSTFDDTTSPTTVHNLSVSSPIYSTNSTHILQDNNISITYSPKKNNNNFLKIKFELSKRRFNENFKRLFIINLRKTFITCKKFLMQETDVKMNNFKYNFNQTYNLSNEQIVRIQSSKKEYLLPLYQILCNNNEIKLSKFMENIFTQKETNRIIHDKFEILEEFSKDNENQWVIYKCKSFEDNCNISNSNSKSQSYSLMEPNCVIKIIDKKKINNFLKIRSHNHELSMMSKMNCRYIMKTREIISSNLYDYHILEYVDSSLQDFVSHNIGLKMEEIWKLFRNLISALDYCKFNNNILGHNVVGVTHRNISPVNTFLNQIKFRIKLSDFAFSCGVEEDEVLNMTTVPYYSPPEYGTEFYKGHLSDIWACGSLLYFMIFKEDVDITKLDSIE
jgi:hypothetical protein